MKILKTNISTKSPKIKNMTTEPWNTAGVWPYRAVTGFCYKWFCHSHISQSCDLLSCFQTSRMCVFSRWSHWKEAFRTRSRERDRTLSPCRCRREAQSYRMWKWSLSKVKTSRCSEHCSVLWDTECGIFSFTDTYSELRGIFDRASSLFLSFPDFFRSLLLSFSPNLEEHNPSVAEWRQDVGRVVRATLSQVYRL